MGSYISICPTGRHESTMRFRRRRLDWCDRPIRIPRCAYHDPTRHSLGVTLYREMPTRTEFCDRFCIVVPPVEMFQQSRCQLNPIPVATNGDTLIRSKYWRRRSCLGLHTPRDHLPWRRKGRVPCSRAMCLGRPRALDGPGKFTSQLDAFDCHMRGA